jgi:hypothetical protein
MAIGRDARGEGCRGFVLDVEEGYLCALFGKAGDEGFADAGGSAGDEDFAGVKTGIDGVLLLFVHFFHGSRVRRAVPISLELCQ